MGAPKYTQGPDRTCRKCGQTKPLTKEYWSTNGGTSWRYQCKECQRAHDRARYHANPSRREHIVQWTKGWRVRNPGRFAAQVERRKSSRQGKSHEWFLVQRQAQDDKCAVCQRPFAQERRPCIDHDHSHCPGTYGCSECVRGLLCVSCNVFVGRLETPGLLEAALAYLEAYKCSVP